MNNLLLRITTAFILFSVCGISVCSQSYTVYSVTGNVKIYKDNNMHRVMPRTMVKATDRIMIGKESAISLIDEKRSKIYSLTLSVTDNVGNIITRQQNKAKSLTKEYTSYLIKQLFDNKSKSVSHPQTYMHATATSFRSINKDSLFLNRVIKYAIDKRDTTTMESLFFDNLYEHDSDFNVSFDIVSYDTGKSVYGGVECGTGCYVKITNNELFPVYVNVLNIDSEGNKYLLLPVDESAFCAHLFVPSESTVSFIDEPFIFPDEQSGELFMLVATKEPVDFSILMNKFPKQNGNSMEVGMSCKLIHTYIQ